MVDRFLTLLAIVGIVAVAVIIVVLAIRLVGLTEKVSAAFFSKNWLLLGSAVAAGVVLAVGYVAGSALLMWVGGGFLALLAVFLVAS